MTIVYDFNGEDYEYEVDVSDWLKDYASPQQLMDIAIDIYDDVLTEEEKKEVPFELVKSGDKDAIEYVMDSEPTEKVVFDKFYDIIKDTYEDEAREMYDDYKEEKRDPYGYRGLRESDFH